MIQTSPNEATIDLNVIDSKGHNKDEVDSLIILNSQICENLLKFFIGSSRNIILCDGAANYFYSTEYRDASNVVIVGDLDSIDQQVREYYKSRIQIIDLSIDQDTNDFEKAIKYAVQLQSKRIVSLGVLGKRFDQEMCNLSVIQKYSEKHENISFIAVGKTSFIYAVKPMVSTVIKISNLFIKNQSGMICFGKAKVKTKGFRWNLGKQYGLQQLQWGVVVSSSNEVVDSEVFIESSHSLFFVIELKQ